jgi:hypothetical protein
MVFVCTLAFFDEHRRTPSLLNDLDDRFVRFSFSICFQPLC